MENKTCNKCNENFPKTNEFFAFKNKAKGYLSPYCKPCERLRCSKNQKKNGHKYAEASRARVSKWAEENHERVRNNKRRWYKDNLDLVKERDKARSKTEHRKQQRKGYYKKSSEKGYWRMNNNISSAIWCVLKKQGGEKHSPTFEHLPYSREQLREHIENQFDDKMNWDNYGAYWDLDHIYPQSLLPYDSMEDENFIKCWSLDNLQPLEKKQNIKKSNKILEEK